MREFLNLIQNLEPMIIYINIMRNLISNMSIYYALWISLNKTMMNILAICLITVIVLYLGIHLYVTLIAPIIISRLKTMMRTIWTKLPVRSLKASENMDHLKNIDLILLLKWAYSWMQMEFRSLCVLILVLIMSKHAQYPLNIK